MLFLVPSGREAVRRLPVVLLGLTCFGVGIGMMVAGDLGLGPWDVFHQGVSELTGVSIGLVVSLTAVVVVLGFIPLRERLGLGTVLNALVIGPVVDLTLAVLGEPDHLAVRTLLMAGGPVMIGIGSGLYIGGGLGPGPRDGLMTGIAARGPAVWKVRTGIELTVLAVGIVLGGSVGVGTIWFALGIGPLVQFFLPRLRFFPPLPDRNDAPSAGGEADVGGSSGEPAGDPTRASDAGQGDPRPPRRG